MRTLICCFSIAGLLFAQQPDAFTGTWKLEARKSHALLKDDRFRSGVKSYGPVQEGKQRVWWNMVDRDGKKEAGDYTVACVEGVCSSDVARWKRVSDREVAGEVIEKGVVTQTYTRAVSADGRTMTITFYEPQSKRKMSSQTWRKQ